MALIDTGALITGLSNKAVAEYLLKAGLEHVKGVVYLDELDRQMVLLRKGLKVVKLVDSGLAWNERFTFYDQVHTTGMDIKQAVDACAALTLGKDMVFRDYAQGSFRMRGIGKGQTIKLLVVPEISDRIKTQVSIGAGLKVNADEYSLNPTQFLRDVLSWLNINSMRVDGIQFNLLCEQNVNNIWRKRSFGRLRNNYNVVGSDKCPPEVIRSLQVFRERVDFEIENSVPQSVKYSQKIFNMIDNHKDILIDDREKKTSQYVLSLIQEEERRTDEIKKQASSSSINVAAADAMDLNGIATEQSFNREQVQVSVFRI